MKQHKRNSNRADEITLALDQTVMLRNTVNKRCSGQPGKAPTKQDIVDYIVAKGQREGLNPCANSDRACYRKSKVLLIILFLVVCKAAGSCWALSAERYGRSSQWAATRAEAANPEIRHNSFRTAI